MTATQIFDSWQKKFVHGETTNTIWEAIGQRLLFPDVNHLCMESKEMSVISQPSA